MTLGHCGSRWAVGSIVLCLVLGTAGCDRVSPAPAAVPRPDLSRAEPEVIRVVEAAADAVERAIQAEAAPERLAEAYGALGETCHAHEFPACGLAAYGEAAALAPGKARWLVLRGHLLMARDRPAEALAAFEQALALEPELPSPLFAAGQAALGADDEASARDLFERQLALEPRHAGALLALGRLDLAAGDLDRAEPRLRAALDAAPAADAIHHALARLERARGRPDVAAAHARRAGARLPTAMDPLLEDVERRRVGVHNLAARAQEEVLSGRLDDAVVTYRGLLATAPDDHRARLNLASVLVRLGRARAARQELKLVLDARPDHPSALFNLGTLELRAGRFDAAADALDRALVADPGHPQAALNRGIVAWERNRIESARTFFARAVEADGLQPLAWRWAAAAEHRIGDDGGALRLLERGGRVIDEVGLAADRVRLLATSSDPSVFAPEAALVEAATMVDEADGLTGPQSWDVWRSAAYAAAAAGRNDLAVERQRRALGAARRTVSGAPISQLREELEDFAAGRIWRLRWWRPLGAVERQPATRVRAAGSDA
ncbi:MAG: tetratricopeptide repeat protein [Acidobacteriota bacterium]